MHLSAIHQALPLVFAFDRTNYKRWLLLYFEDCLSLPIKYPLIYESLLDGKFVVNLSKRSASAVPMDQALESKYNKPANSASGIIGITPKKEAVCKWNLMKHEQSNYTSLLREISGSIRQRIEVDKRCANHLACYVQERGNPFDVKEDAIKNLVTGTTLSDEATSFFLNCFTKGKENYDKFMKERLQDKETKLFDAIPKTRSTTQKGKIWKAPDVKKETINFLRIVDYSRLREFDVQYLLSYEIVSTSFYLTKDGSLRKSPKSELAREVKNLLGESCPATVPESEERLKAMVVIDFMAYAREVAT